MPGKLSQKILGHFGLHGHDGPRDHAPNSGESFTSHHHHHHHHHHFGTPTTPNPPARWSLAPEEYQLNTTGTYPRLTRLSDGSILCVSTAFEGPTHILQVTRSEDNGRTFTRHGEIARGEGDLDNGFLLEIPPSSSTSSSSSGEAENEGPVILAAFRNHDRDPAGGGKPTHFRITVCRSRDGGRTWAFASQAAEQSAAASGGMGLWEPFMRLACHDDDLNTPTAAGGDRREAAAAVVHLTYSGELSPANQETFVVTSADGGATWSSPPRCLRCHGEREDLRDGMQGVVAARDAMPDGHGDMDALVMVFETTRRGTFSVEYAVSYDGGRSWGARDVVYCPPSASTTTTGEGGGRSRRNAGAPQIVAVGGRRLVVVFMTDEDSEAAPAWPDRAAVKAVFSEGLQGGKAQWTAPLTIHPATCFWPGVMGTGEREVMVVFEHGGKPLGKVLRLS
ncbi:glycoside hydrolase family 93 protein [Xylariomycetidae sp. FL2044]|nr:glycoside hydrolase family 93 protein [Xylariomycetidae sp. FL2044]